LQAKQFLPHFLGLFLGRKFDHNQIAHLSYSPQNVAPRDKIGFLITTFRDGAARVRS
jgi:hypothetical protein